MMMMTRRRTIRKPAPGQLAIPGFGADDRPLPLALRLDWTAPDDPPAAVAPGIEDDPPAPTPVPASPIRKRRQPPAAPPRVIAIRAGAANLDGANPFAAAGIARWELPPGAPCGKCGATPHMRRRWQWGGLEITACIACGNDGQRRPAPPPDDANTPRVAGLAA